MLFRSWLKLTTQETTVIGEDAEKEEPFCTACGNANWPATLENSREVPQKIKNTTTLPTQLGIYPNDTGVLFRRGTYTPMFIAVLLTIAKVQKDPKCPLMDE